MGLLLIIQMQRVTTTQANLFPNSPGFRSTIAEEGQGDESNQIHQPFNDLSRELW